MQHSCCLIVIDDDGLDASSLLRLPVFEMVKALVKADIVMIGMGGEQNFGELEEFFGPSLGRSIRDPKGDRCGKIRACL